MPTKPTAENMKNDNYIPFGDEWRKEVMKCSKDQIIEMFKIRCLHCQDLENQLASLTPSAETGWISVKERLPEADSHVLAFGKWEGEINGANDFYTIGIVQWKSAEMSELIDTDAYGAWLKEITHWQPLPPSPKTITR